MKKNSSPIICIVTKLTKSVLLSFALLMLVVSCDDIVNSYDPQLLHGKWVSGSEFWRYDDDGTGVTWDTADDVHEDEAQMFKWEYDDSDKSLTHIHWMEMTQEWTVPRVYTITWLSDAELVYVDKFGKSYSFKKLTDSL